MIRLNIIIKRFNKYFQFAVPVAFLCAGAVAGYASVIDGIDYPDDMAARKNWKAMGETAAVSLVEKNGQRVLRMPCNFKGTRMERASWDRSVKLDLAFCQGIKFRFYCSDMAPISSFSLYFQSGKGWYSTTFAPERTGAWNTIMIDKASTSIEGGPDGWGKISTIRISAWRGGGADTELFLSDIRVVGQDAPIVVVRGDSVAKKNPQEGKSVSKFAETIANGLKDLRLPHLLVSDLDSIGDALKNRKLVILPHNPSMPDPAASAIADFLKSGGKLIAFYGFPHQLQEAAGIQPGDFVRQKSPGNFARIRFSDPLPPGMPREVLQGSWNIRDAKLITGRGRVAAEWFDKDGNPTGNSALVRTDSAYIMTHVLLDDGGTDKRRMLLAMVGDLVPELWETAALDTVARIGQFGPFAGFDSAISEIGAQAKGRPEALVALEKATACRNRMNTLVNDGKYPDAMAQASETQKLLVDAYCRAQSSEPGEQRGFWCHSAHGAGGMEWDDAIKVMAENGFNAIFPNMLWGGSADYESSVLPVSPDVAQKGDAIVKCLAACRKYGVKCHVWKVNWNTGGRAPKEFIDKITSEGRGQVRFDGTSENKWLCPSHPVNRKLECDAMVEVAAKYDVDGIHFDYIRYPDRDGCFCSGCRQRFEEAIGQKIGNWPRDVRSDKVLEAKWLDFRRAQITALVAMVNEQARKVRPKIQISAAVFSNWQVDRDGVGQDWKLWCEKGYVDFVCPMDYTEHDSAFENIVIKQKEWAGQKPCYPGIGLTCWTPADDVVNLIGKIKITRKHGMRGFTVFDYSPASTRSVIERCGLGVTKSN